MRTLDRVCLCAKRMAEFTANLVGACAVAACPYFILSIRTNEFINSIKSIFSILFPRSARPSNRINSRKLFRRAIVRSFRSRRAAFAASGRFNISRKRFRLAGTYLMSGDVGGEGRFQASTVPPSGTRRDDQHGLRAIALLGCFVLYSRRREQRCRKLGAITNPARARVKHGARMRIRFHDPSIEMPGRMPEDR